MSRNAPWRAWYSTAEWRRLKRLVHERDGYICQMPGCGRLCGGQSPADDSPIADHKTPHRGNRQLFFDPENVQTLCKFPCHDKVKQREEQASLGTEGEWY